MMMGCAGDAEFESFDGAVLRTGAKIVHAAVQVVFDGEGLQGFGNLVGEVAADWQLALKERLTGAQLLGQFLIGEPDEVFEADGHERIGVLDLQGEFYALGIELEDVGDVAESAGFSQVLAHAFEVFVVDGLAQLQAGGGDDLGRSVTGGAGDFDGNQL